MTLAVAFRLGLKSEEKLVGVDPALAGCVRRAITTTTQDFGVFEGLRYLERQRMLVASGASRTLDSYHLPDATGTGHAVDLVPYIGGRLQWQMPPCLKVASAMHAASTLLGVSLIWGGVWDRPFSSLDPDNLAHEIELYKIRYQRTHPPTWVGGERVYHYPLVDAPHFQSRRPVAAAAVAP